MEGPDLLQTFETELRRSAEQIEARLLALEGAEPVAAREHLHEAYRLTHSVKGASRVVGLSNVEELAHALEDRLQVLVREAAIPGQAEVSAFLGVIDGFVACLEDFLQGSERDVAPLLDLFRAAVALATAKPAEGPPGADPAPEPAPPAHATPAPPPAPPIPAPTPPATPPAPAPPRPEPAPEGPPKPVERRAFVPGPEDPAAPTAPVPGSASRKDEFLHVPTQAVDELFRRVEEAFLIESRLATLAQTVDEAPADGAGADERARAAANLHREVSRLHQVLLHFHELVRAFRMEPLERLRVPLQRAVRDVASEVGRQAAFRLGNPRQLVDTALLDGLLEPLLHLVRNAVDHGLEPPQERVAAGKPPEGLVEVDGAMRGSSLELVVRDDGRGMSVEAIKAKALESGFVTADQARTWTDAQWLSLPFRPGFSTATRVSAISGRGMGLDIVRDRVRGLGGDVYVSTRSGRGTTVEIRVPVRLLTARTLLLRCGGRLAGLPVAEVERVLRYRAEDAESVAGQTHVRWQQLPIPLDLLSGYLGWSGAPPTSGHVVVVNRQGTRRGLLVEEVLGEVEQPALPAPWNLRSLAYLGGLIVMGDGSLVPLLELRELVPWGAAAGAVDVTAVPVTVPERKSDRRVVLVVDDSATIRALHRSVLQSVGYEILTADDGADALALLHRRAVDLVITDIQMPRLDGLTLIRRVREVGAWQRLPIIVVSQYGRRDDLQKAAAAGADRYIVKSSFDPRQLVDMVAELLA